MLCYYTCFLWYTGLPKLYKNKLQIYQNKSKRSVLKLDLRCYIFPEHFKYLNCLLVEERVNQIKLICVKKNSVRFGPSYMSEGYVLANVNHHQCTRFIQSMSLVVPRVNKMVGNN